jgi:5-methylcytosine-specific restriction endonuclease McrA
MRRKVNPDPAKRAYDRQRYLDRRQETINRVSIWQKDNPDLVNAKNSRWRHDHWTQIKDRVVAHNRRYLRANPGVNATNMARRRAMKRGLPDTLTRTEWEAIKAAYGNRCAYCGKKQKHSLTQDHVVPLSKRGGTIRENIVPACKSCNSSKRNNLPAKPVRLVLL